MDEPKDTVQEGTFVLLYFPRKGKVFFRRVGRGKVQTHAGTLDWEALLGRPFGVVHQTHLGEPFVALPPTGLDLAKHVIRQTQIVYPKDLAYIAGRLGLQAGKRVLECGTGSGAAATYFAYLLQPTGRLYSYEARPEFQELARRNLERYGLLPWVELKCRRAEEGFDETGVDAVFLDLPEPWVALAAARQALRPGAPLACLLPTFSQVERMLQALWEEGFLAIEMEELLLRPYRPFPGRVRPEDRMVAHTGYLLFARKGSTPLTPVEEMEEALDKSSDFVV